MNNTYKPDIGHVVRTLADNQGVIKSAEHNGHCIEYKMDVKGGEVRFNRYAIIEACLPNSDVFGVVTHTATISQIWMGRNVPAFVRNAPSKRRK